MKVLLILSPRQVHRASNSEMYKALKARLPELTWCAGVELDLDKSLPKGYMYLQSVDLKTFQTARAKKFEIKDFDIAIIDQSHDMTQDQSPSLFEGILGGSGPANRSLDFDGRDRPSSIVRDLTEQGIVCIGTSRDGRCCDELASVGAVLTCALADLPARLLEFMVEAERLVRDNRNDKKAGLKALSLRQPFAHSVFQFEKDVENRTWPTQVRGTIAIHAAHDQPPGTFFNGSKFVRDLLNHQGRNSLRLPKYEEYVRGAILGVVDIVDVVKESDSLWFEGPLGFKLANPRLLKQPIPCPSKRRFWVLPPEVARQVSEQLKTTG